MSTSGLEVSGLLEALLHHPLDGLSAPAQDPWFAQDFSQTQIGKTLYLPGESRLAANPGFARMLGFESRQLGEHTLAGLLEPGQLAGLADALRTLVARQGQHARLILTYRHRQGHPVAGLTDFLVRYQGTQGFAGLIMEVRDLSAQVEAEQAFRQEHARLRIAERLAGLGAFELDIASGRIQISDNLRRIFGLALPADYSLGDCLSLVHAEDRGGLESALLQAIQTGRTFAAEFRASLANGREGTFLCQGRSFNTGYRISGYLLDVTPYRRSERSLQAANHWLTRQNAQLRQLAQLVSDELTGTLAGLQAIAALQEEQAGPPIEKFELDLLDKVSREIRQTQRLEPERRRISLALAWNSVRQMLEADIQRSGARIEVDLSAWSELEFVPGYLENMLFNLLSASLELMAGLGGRLKLSTARVDGARELRLLVEDCEAGRAIDIRRQPKLMLVASLLEANGGRLLLKDGEGKRPCLILHF